MLRVCWFWLILTALLGSASGCTPLRTWVRNGFKVGPNHVPPTVDVEKDWIDQDSPLLAEARRLYGIMHAHRLRP